MGYPVQFPPSPSTGALNFPRVFGETFPYLLGERVRGSLTKHGNVQNWVILPALASKPPSQGWGKGSNRVGIGDERTLPVIVNYYNSLPAVPRGNQVIPEITPETF